MFGADTAARFPIVEAHEWSIQIISFQIISWFKVSFLSYFTLQACGYWCDVCNSRCVSCHVHSNSAGSECIGNTNLSSVWVFWFLSSIWCDSLCLRWTCCLSYNSTWYEKSKGFLKSCNCGVCRWVWLLHSLSFGAQCQCKLKPRLLLPPHPPTLLFPKIPFNALLRNIAERNLIDNDTNAVELSLDSKYVTCLERKGEVLPSASHPTPMSVILEW